MAYDSITTVNMTSGIDELFYWLNEVTGLWFGNMMILAIFLVFLFGYLRAKSDDFVGGLAVSSYVTFVIGLMFWVIGIINGYTFGVVVGVTAISSVVLLLQKKEY